MLKQLFKRIGLALVVIFAVQLIAYAQNGGEGSGPETEPDNPTEAGFQSRCDSENVKAMNFPDCANSPSECASQPFGVVGKATTEGGSEYSTLDIVYRAPFNCLFLQEPIGGDPGYDLYKLTKQGYVLWYGEAIVGDESGPHQAILVYEPGKDLQGPFGVVYNYLGLIYNFMSGIIIGFVILMVIIGGIRMTTSAGSADKYGEGKKMIIKALAGMLLWFLASVILYTINPTFFTF